MSERLKALALERRRFGYRRIGDLIRADGAPINDKRVYRLYRLADLAVRKRRSKKRLKLERVPLHRCETINEVRSMDFVSDSLANGRRIKCLTITDDFSHECVDIAVDHGINQNDKARLRRASQVLHSTEEFWLRGLDLNQRPLGYEPNELPDCSTPRLSR
jgi:putative transposase